MFDFSNELMHIREAYKMNPYREYNLPIPQWLTKKDKLYCVIKEHNKVFKKGNIYMGVMIQANSLLFSNDNPHNCPGEFAYSEDEWLNSHPEEIEKIATELYSYKYNYEAVIPAKYITIVNSIRNEMDRNSFVVDYEKPDGTNAKIHIVATMVYRKYLPEGYIKNAKYFPIIAKTNRYKTVMIVPHFYWSDLFKLECWNFKLENYYKEEDDYAIY